MTSTRIISWATFTTSRSIAWRATIGWSPRSTRLPGRKFIHTNGNADYAWKVLDRLGIAAEVDHLHDIFAADLTPKPELHGYRKLLDQFGIDPTQAVMVEDMVRNLAPAKAARHDDGVGRQWLGARQSRL